MKIALVTGAGSGIGRAVSVGLAQAGYAVTLVGRRQASLEETAAAIGNDVPTLVAPADVGDADAVQRVFAEVRRSFGRLDVLFNNAGLSAPAVPLEELTAAQWRAVVDANLTGAFLCTQQAFHIMKAQDPRCGRVINNGSLAAYVPRPFSAPYAASKHGITGLTRASALEGRRYDIACGQIDIGNAETEMTARVVDGALQPDGRLMPEPRLDLDSVVRAVVYMASLPLDANVLFLTVMATKMPFVGRG